METLNQNENSGIDAFILKIIAILGMTSDHIGIIFGSFLSLPLQTLLFAPGGLTFPIMGFLITEGYRHTASFHRYALRLLIFALIAQAPFSWANGTFTGNILFTLLAGLIVLYLYDHMKPRILFWIMFLLISLLTVFFDWPLVGVPMILCYHTLKGRWTRIIVPVLIADLLLVLPPLPILLAGETGVLPGIMFGLVGCSLTIPLLGNYSGRRGRPMKYFFYIYYPAHLLVLALIRHVLL